MSNSDNRVWNNVVAQTDSILLEPVRPVNSTTYVDLLGVLAGLERLEGEPADQFYERILIAGKSNRSSEYIGLLNEINLQLGTRLFHCMEVSGAEPFDFQATHAAVQTAFNGDSYSTPLFTVDKDDYLVWRTIQDIADDINSHTGLQATVLEDGPALWLVRQSNRLHQLNEEIHDQLMRLEKAYPVPGSELLVGEQTGYSFLTASLIRFDSRPAPGTKISYQYRICPYKVVGSPINLISLTDPSFLTYATAPGGRITFQAREALHALSLADRSYWTV